jgi:hypothetical protein
MVQKTNTDLLPSEIAALNQARRRKAEERANRHKVRDEKKIIR